MIAMAEPKSPVAFPAATDRRIGADQTERPAPSLSL